MGLCLITLWSMANSHGTNCPERFDTVGKTLTLRREEKDSRMVSQIQQSKKGVRDTKELLDPVMRAAVADLAVEAHRAVEGTISGLHHSHVRGRNVEFSEHRPYNPGDELRHVDWRVFARSDRFHIKLFEEDTNLRAWMWLDGSGSMAAGVGRQCKFEYAIRLAAAVSELMLRQGDAVGLGYLGAEEKTITVPPRSGREHLHALLSTLVEVEASGAVALSERLSRLPGFVGQRGMIFLFSDLADDPDRVLRCLDLLRKHQHEVIVIQLLTAEEIEFPYRQAVKFVDLESDEVLDCSPRPIRAAYREKVEAFLRAYRRGCSERSIEYHLVRTDQAPETWLRQFLVRRADRSETRGGQK